MKLYKTLGMAMGIALFQPLAAKAAGDLLYRLSWRGVVYSTVNGQLSARGISERDFIQKVAADNGMDPMTLVFVYRPLKHDTAGVRASDGLFIADVIQMENLHTDVSNASQTFIVRQIYLQMEAPPPAVAEVTIGSAFGIETARYDAGGNMISDSFHGTFQYSIDGAVYSGSFATGGRVKDTSP